MLIAGWLIAGCVIQEPRAITEIGRARKALDEAKKAGSADRAPDKFADLEKRYLRARGVYYSCNDAEAIRLAQSIIADLLLRWQFPRPQHPRIGRQWHA